MKKLLAVTVLAGTIGVGAWKLRGGHATEPADLVVDRLWIDHMPTNGRDVVNVFMAFDSEAMGVFQKGSRWIGSYEMFHFELDGGQMRIAYPQTGKHELVKLRARSCDENQMDFCLEVEGATRGVKQYYSMEGWDFRSQKDAEAMLNRLTK
jgi:hypothetical protein